MGETEETELVFVYGTLKRDFNNSQIMDNNKANFISEVETIQKYCMFDLGNGFPYLQDNKNTNGMGDIIQGELWKVPKSKIKDLDYFEGVPTLYKKGKISVKLENIVWNDVNVYFITDELTQEEINSLDKIKKFNEWVE